MSCYIWQYKREDGTTIYIAVMAESEAAAIGRVSLRDDADFWLPIVKNQDYSWALHTTYNNTFTFGP